MHRSNGDRTKANDLRDSVLRDFSLPPLPDERENLVEVCRPLLPKAEKILPYLKQIDASRRYSNHGRLVMALQARLREAVGGFAEVAVASSGTSALAGAILATAGRATRTRPLCLLPAYTFIGTVSAIEQCGFTPFLLDVDPQTWMIDPQACLGHPLLDQVGLVVPVAPYGRPVPQSDWSVFQQQTGVKVVIDGAAAFESLVRAPELFLGEVPVAVSFHATKSFCTGEGGGVFCSDPMIWRAAIQTLNFGYDSDRVCRRPGVNGKMSEYHAAVGLAELDGWDSKLARFQQAARYFESGTARLRGRLHVAPSVASNYVIFEAETLEESDAVVARLRAARIGFRKWYGAGVHHQPYCETVGRDRLSVSDRLARLLIGLPMAADLDRPTADYVMQALAPPRARPPRSDVSDLASATPLSNPGITRRRTAL
jgi:dTDP-4-amino-4,6-dideoxygalactose transaminase